VFIVWRSDPSAVVAATRGARLSWLAVAVALVLVDRSLMAYRWLVLVRVFDSPARLPLLSILRVFFVSTFVGTFLPASVGSDAIRAYGLTRLRASGATSVASVLMDRLLGVLSLLVVTVAGLCFARDLVRNAAVVGALGMAAAVCGVALSAVYSERVARFAGRVLTIIPSDAAGRVARNLVGAVRAYATRHGALANALGGSIAVQLVRVAQAYALGLSLGLSLPFTVYLAFVPLILLVMLLPISIYGLGTSQLAFAALFARAGVPAGEAVALSLLFVGLGIVGNLPGAMLYVTGGRQRPTEAVG